MKFENVFLFPGTEQKLVKFRKIKYYTFIVSILYIFIIYYLYS